MSVVTVIIPVYNRERTLQRCVDSIRKQTLEDLQILLVDDGSVDGSSAMCDVFARLDPRIQAVHQENRGPGAARNRGLSLASSRFVAFVDSDDWIEPDMLELLLRPAIAFDAEIVQCNYVEDYGDAPRDIIVRHPQPTGRLLAPNAIEGIVASFLGDGNFGYYALTNKLFARGFLLHQEFRIEEDKWYGEDWWYAIRLFRRSRRIAFIPEAPYHYMRDTEGLSTTQGTDRLEAYREGHLRMAELAAELGADPSAIDARFIREVFAYLLASFDVGSSPKVDGTSVRGVLRLNDVVASAGTWRSLPFTYRIPARWTSGRHEGLALRYLRVLHAFRRLLRR